MTAPRKYIVKSETITPRVVRMNVPPAIVGFNEYDENPRFPAEPCIWRSYDCADLDRNQGYGK